MRVSSASKFANHIGSHLAEIRSGGTILIIERFNRPVAALISLPDLEFLTTNKSLDNQELSETLEALRWEMENIKRVESERDYERRDG